MNSKKFESIMLGETMVFLAAAHLTNVYLIINLFG